MPVTTAAEPLHREGSGRCRAVARPVARRSRPRALRERLRRALVRSSSRPSILRSTIPGCIGASFERGPREQVGSTSSEASSHISSSTRSLLVSATIARGAVQGGRRWRRARAFAASRPRPHATTRSRRSIPVAPETMVRTSPFVPRNVDHREAGRPLAEIEGCEAELDRDPPRSSLREGDRGRFPSARGSSALLPWSMCPAVPSTSRLAVSQRGLNRLRGHRAPCRGWSTCGTANEPPAPSWWISSSVRISARAIEIGRPVQGVRRTRSSSRPRA